MNWSPRILVIDMDVCVYCTEYITTAVSVQETFVYSQNCLCSYESNNKHLQFPLTIAIAII